jgi:hypothetical protein
MICPDCGGKKYRRNPDLHLRELERQFAGGDEAVIAPLVRAYLRQGRAPDLDAGDLALLRRHGGEQLLLNYLMARLRMRIRSGLPVDYVRRAAALGDARAEAIGLEPWPVDGFWGLNEITGETGRAFYSILRGLPKQLVVSFAADVAERIPDPEYGAHHTMVAQRACSAARAWVQDPSAKNAEEASLWADAAWASFDNLVQSSHGDFEFAAAASHAAAAATGAYPNYTYPEPEDEEDDWTASNATSAANAAENGVEELAWQKQRLIQYLLGEVQV